MNNFQLPRDGLTYIEGILTRCHDLIDRKIWEGLHISRIKGWMANFITDEEKYFAACLLDSLIYRSEAQTIALIKQLFQRILPDLCRSIVPPIGKNPDWLQILDKGTQSDPMVRLVTAVKQSDPPTKSAYVVVRLMKRYLNIGEDWIINPADINKSIKAGVKTYLFIDDFLGTGSQFEGFLIEENIEPCLGSNFMAYVPLAGHTSGIQYLSGRFPALQVRPVECLDDTHSLFNTQAPCFNDGVNTPHSALEFYLELLRGRGINITGQDRRGFGGLELAYTFCHAAPDNCLPILWWDNTPHWNSLFKR